MLNQIVEDSVQKRFDNNSKKGNIDSGISYADAKVRHCGNGEYREQTKK